MAIGLGDLVDREGLRQLAGSRYFRRGESYFADGAVESCQLEGGEIHGEVRGAHLYRTELAVKGGALVFDCSCPLGQDGEFCKHLVATGLAWLGGGAVEKPRGGASMWDDLRCHLSKKRKSELVDLLIEQAQKDEVLGDRLLLQVAGTASPEVDLVRFEALIDDAIAVDEFVPYDAMWDYSERLQLIVETLRGLIEAGRAEAVIGLSEHALACTESAIEHVDDSAGIMGQFLRDLQRLHLEACTIAKPDPALLARRLFVWALRTEWDTFSNAANDYAAVFGDAGMREYRRLAEEEWAKVPPLAPGAVSSERYGGRFRITHIMRAIAERSGDVDALIALEGRDLSIPYSFLTIAALCRSADRHDEAIEWAERGVREFKDHIDHRLYELLADEYQHQKRYDEAIETGWSLFTQLPSLETFGVLRRHAKRAKAWSKWCERAIDFIRKKIADGKKERGADRFRRWSATVDHSLLVEIYLDEKDADAAWAEATAGGCSARLWMELAQRREASHPSDAAAVYRRLIEPVVNHKDKASYKEAAQLVGKVRTLMIEAGETAEFGQYLLQLRANHGRKRNFMDALAKAGID